MSKDNTAPSNVIPFDFRGHSVRAITLDGEPWFVASDVCRVLDVANTTQAMHALDEDERSMFNIGRQGDANIINESGLYTLILRCRDAVKKGSKPHAFRKWVTSEVLPAIRKKGSYADSNGQMKPLMAGVVQISMPISPVQRFLVSLGRDGNPRISEVPIGACVKTVPEFISTLQDAGGLGLTLEEQFSLIALGTQLLKFQSQRVGMRARA